jgi:alpha-glucosidase
MRSPTIILTVLLSIFADFRAAAADYQISSPDGKLVTAIRLNNGSLSYCVAYAQQPVILESKFSLTCQGKSWDSDLSISNSIELQKNTIWKPLYGERAFIRANFNEQTFHLAKQGQPRIAIRLIVRAYNEGLAFRFGFSETSPIYGIPPFRITDEATEYTFAEGTKAWFTARAQTRYELLPLKNWPGQSERPLVLTLTNGLFACLTEAELVNYSRSKFSLAAKKPNTIVGTMFDGVDELPPFLTPWRVIMVAKSPGELLEHNDLILNLNPPCALTNTAWIKPGKNMREMSISTEGSKRQVDFAAAHNIQFLDLTFWNGDDLTYNADKVAVPAWRSTKPLDMQEVVRYAKSKGIGVWLYVNQRPLARQLDELLPLYESWGVVGIKFGFVHVGSHRWTTWLHEAVKKCAAHHLMVDIHDEYRPTGFSRTYPNLMTQEGVLGNEGWPDATHNTTLPFTRYLAGPADYTYCYFECAPNAAGVTASKVKTTMAHQLALPLVYYSPVQWLYWYDKPESFQGEPELALWDAMPTVWDDTKVVAGEIGQYAAIARRSGEQWFVGIITNNKERELKLPLTFLTAGKKYEATICSDDPTVKTRTHVAVKTQAVNSETELTVKLLASGGQALMIKPLP